MTYSQEISQEFPGAFLFLVDQSKSMDKPFGSDKEGKPVSRAEVLAEALNNTLATTLIGNKIKAIGNSLNKSAGEDTEIHFRLASAAQKVTINITDANGVVVRTLELSGQSSGDHSLEWDGKDNSGNELSDGVYQFSVTAQDGSGNDVGALTFTTGVIDGIRYNNGAAMLILGDIEVNMSDVFEIGFNPGAAESQVRRESIGNGS